MELEEALIAIRQRADQHRFLFEMWLNVKVTTDTFYMYGWEDHTPAVGGAEEITAKYRARQVIK